MKIIHEAKTKSCSESSIHQFKQKFSDKLFSFQPSTNDIHDISNTVYVKDVAIFLDLLKTFGNLISKLSLTYSHLVPDQIREINAHVSVNCFKSLSELHIESWGENAFDGLNGTFENLIQLSISGKVQKLNGKSVKLDKFFPNLETLSLQFIHVYDLDVIHRNFPQLENLHVIVGRSDSDEFSESNVENLLKNNPQIQRLRLGQANLSFLKKVRKILTKLDTLELPTLFMDTVKGDIHFETVKSLSLPMSLDGIPKHLVFGQIEKVHFDCKIDKELDEDCFNFVGNQTNLRKLSTRKCYLNNVGFETLSEKCPKLSEVTVKLSSDVKAVSVLKFLQNENLKKISLENCTRNVTIGILVGACVKFKVIFVSKNLDKIDLER